MTAEHKYEMTISLQIVEHLGLNLYSNTSAVISEAVANAWDADAKTVEITLEKDCITIKDDGCGMDTDDINNKYLTVGYQKRHLVPITPMLNRKVMGRKGIGKLSLLSIAETITIYSSKNGQKNALQISTQKLREAVSQTQTYYPEEVDDSGIDFEGNGTKIVLTNLKKSRTTALAGKLKQRLARRFAVIGADKQFEVKVNGEPITISDRNYLTKAQYLWYYLRPADEDIPAQPADEYTKQCKSGVLRKSFSRSGELSIAGKPAYVYGWIATAPKPGDLDDDENINRIAIMVRGKMAKDDIQSAVKGTAGDDQIFSFLHGVLDGVQIGAVQVSCGHKEVAVLVAHRLFPEQIAVWMIVESLVQGHRSRQHIGVIVLVDNIFIKGVFVNERGCYLIEAVAAATLPVNRFCNT